MRFINAQAYPHSNSLPVHVGARFIAPAVPDMHLWKENTWWGKVYD